MKPRRLAFGCGLAILLFLLICFGLYIYLEFDRTSDFGTLFRFADAMRANEALRAKWFSAPDQWNRIDAWMNKHKAFSCPAWYYNTDGAWGGGDFDVSAHEKENLFETDGCGGHRLDFRNIYVEHRGRDWIVVSWESVCETGYNDEGLCDPPK